ncbi:hypothetical protein C5167_044983 [Papaver somniferum]|uniref:Uncharacterized protein n=1 Tax=Papaver somniferum TaxID=3469 RepID=A0A4Y7LCE6_PAPSO|nr:uncharacterized protein LOC113320290 [Papaver somniferum]RZC82198.1 hypothetical protein C5167_044983 [Papaver somniferum]
MKKKKNRRKEKKKKIMQRENSPYCWAPVPPPSTPPPVPPAQSQYTFSAERFPAPWTGNISNQNSGMMSPTDPCLQMRPPSGALPNLKQGWAPPLAKVNNHSLAMRPPTPVSVNQGWAPPLAPVNNHSIAVRPPSPAQVNNHSLVVRPPPPAQGAWPSFPPAQMMNHGIVNNKSRPLDLGMFPPWQLSVTLPGGENRYINIPYSEGTHVIGLPLGLDVPEVIASNYKALLCMVSGMTCIINSQFLNLDRYQKNTASYWEDIVNRYRLEIQELKSAPQEAMASVSPSKKRKMSAEESSPCETKTVCITKPEHLPPPISIETPANPVPLVQESVIEEDMDETDDFPLPSVKRARGKDVPTGAALSCSDVQTEKVESVARLETTEETVDATMTSNSANCPTFDSATLTNSTPKEVTLPVVESVTGVAPTGEPFDATMTSTSANCLNVDSTTLTSSADTDITPSLVESTSVSGQVGDEWFAYVENFNIPKEYAVLYKKIYNKYGHIATKKVIKSNDAILLAAVTSLLKIARTMETARGVDLSEPLLESWEGDIKDAETLQFNVKWLREKFNRVKIYWKLALRIDKEVESRELVLDATQAKYVGLYSRKDELDSEISEVKINLRKSEAKISSQREAIREKIAQKNTFLYEPILGNLFS